MSEFFDLNSESDYYRQAEIVKVSVIIPAYNTEKYIAKCLSSLVNQTLKDIEIIVVDDGSTDGTKSIISQFAVKDKRIKIIEQCNKGPSAARNTGIKAAQGEYIGFVDADDWVDNDFYERLYSGAKKFNSDCAATSFVRSGKFIKSKRCNYKKEEFFTDISIKVARAFIPRFNYVWNKIYKRDALLKLNILFPEGRLYEDIYWLVRVVYGLNGLVTVPGTYYHYRRNNTSIVTKRSQKTKIDNINAYKDLFNFMREHNINILLPCSTGEKEKIRFMGIKILQKEFYYPNTEVYKLFGLFKILTIEKDGFRQPF